jgi:hypothetical protein
MWRSNLSWLDQNEKRHRDEEDGEAKDRCAHLMLRYGDSSRVDMSGWLRTSSRIEPTLSFLSPDFF